jgi:beta-lactamase superfamily II metal-dependent hydrolase
MEENQEIGVLQEAKKKVFAVTSLPATVGDSFWITYGVEDDFHHILIDGGKGGTRSAFTPFFNKLNEDKREMELIVVTHVDSDHIEGILKIVEALSLPVKVKEIWYNSYKHLVEAEELEELGGKMGERLSIGINTHHIPWNTHFGSKAVVVPKDEKESLPSFDLTRGMKLTLLSPSPSKLSALKSVWEAEVLAANLVPGYGDAEIESSLPEDIEELGQNDAPDFDELNKIKFDEDNSKGNGSSIAFIAEFAGKKVLFAGDAQPSVIISSLNRLESEKYKIDLLKVSHHGSTGNTGDKLVEKLDCKNYLFSTNHGTHPTFYTLAYILKRGTANPTLWFNYPIQKTKPWESLVLKAKHKYATEYGDSKGLTIDILDL